MAKKKKAFHGKAELTGMHKKSGKKKSNSATMAPSTKGKKSGR
jgi:hypothetical protein